MLSPRQRRLVADYEAIRAEFAGHEHVHVEPIGHLPPEAHRPLLTRVASWLRPGGLLLTSAPLAPDSGVEEGWLGVPMFFGGIGTDATLAAIADAGLTLESAQVVEEDEGDNTTVGFLWVLATRPFESPVTPEAPREAGPRIEPA